MKKLRIVIIALIVLAILGIVMLHLCPSFENWLHQITGWY
jgi:hypothetical protein